MRTRLNPEELGGDRDNRGDSFTTAISRSSVYQSSTLTVVKASNDEQSGAVNRKPCGNRITFPAPSTVSTQ